METLLVSTGVVALAEIGDKTQLLSLMLAARHKRPWPIIAGIFIATLANHALAGALGAWLTRLLGPDPLRWIAGLSFIAMAGWSLVPDKLEGAGGRFERLGVFWTTVALFFLVEMGDKTQVATVVLAARFNAFAPVVLGTTLGMMIANAPVVLLGEALARRIPVKIIRGVAAAAFAALGVAALLGPNLA